MITQPSNPGVSDSKVSGSLPPCLAMLFAGTGGKVEKPLSFAYFMKHFSETLDGATENKLRSCLSFPGVIDSLNKHLLRLWFILQTLCLHLG
jgi:hypothetical protein